MSLGNKHGFNGNYLMKKFLITFVKIIVFFIGWAVLAGIIDVPNDNPAIWRFFAELIPLVVLLIITTVFLLIEKKKVHIPVKQNCIKGIMSGTVVGFIWIGIAWGILFLLKQFQIIGKSEVPLFWLWIISAFINVVMQELLVRGYIYQLLKTKYNLTVAIIITTILFTVMHGGAIEAGVLPVVNVVTMCLFTTALYEAEGTLLAPIMAHAVWNIVGSLFLGGVSLADDYPHLLTLSASANTLLSGGNYKIEASIITTVLNIVLMTFFWVRYRKGKAVE